MPSAANPKTPDSLRTAHGVSLLLSWSVGVPEAYVRGKDGDRVRFPDGPLAKWAARSMGGRLVCTQVIGVRLPGGPLNTTGSSSNGKTPVRQAGDPGSIPGGSTETEGIRIGSGSWVLTSCPLRVG